MLRTERFHLKPLDDLDYERFLQTMLTDSRVVQFFYSYKGLNDIDEIRTKAKDDFLKYFENSRKKGLEIWAAYQTNDNEKLVGWCGLVVSELTDKYGDWEIQYMIHGDFHGKGVATEIAKATIDHAKKNLKLKRLIATVDIPNIGSVRVLEKLGFSNLGQIEAYGSTEMYLLEKIL